MRYEILGPIRVVNGGIPAFISTPKIEITLAVLLIHADHVVVPGTLMAEIWGERPPRRAAAGIYVYVSQLRKFLRRQDLHFDPIVTQPSGYLLRTGSDEVDVHKFAQSIDRGRALMKEGRYEDASAFLESALQLWRGPVLGGLRGGPSLEGFATQLSEARLECLELLADAQLALGRHRELVSRLYAIIAQNPLREVFYRQLMLALHRSDVQAEALHVYQMARRTLHSELGLEPCRALRNLQQAILADAVSLL
jgi:DNA-binding SARP family transcriptional activator